MPINIQMPTGEMRRVTGVLMTAAALSGMIYSTCPAEAQIYQVAGVGHAALNKAPRTEQMSVLSRLVKEATKEVCPPTSVRMKSTNKEGSGFWVVRCESGRDFLVLVPADGTKGGVAMSCVLAKATTKQDCYSGS